MYCRADSPRRVVHASVKRNVPVLRMFQVYLSLADAVVRETFCAPRTGADVPEVIECACPHRIVITSVVDETGELGSPSRDPVSRFEFMSCLEDSCEEPVKFSRNQLPRYIEVSSAADY